MASWLIILLIIGINWFFVAAEFALVKVRSSQIDLLSKQGNKKAQRIQHISDNLDNYLSACQLGITIASLALWWVGEPLVARQFLQLSHGFWRDVSPETAHAIAIPIAFFLITTLHIVIGEQAPKSFAIRDPLPTSLFVVYPLYRFYRIFKPLIWFLNTLSLAFLRLFGISTPNEEQSHSEEELRMIVAESAEDGHINNAERDLIHNVFEFDNRQVSEIMTPAHKIYSYSINERNATSIHEILAEGYSRIPFYEENINNIIGWVLLKDLLQYHLTNPEGLDIKSLIRPMQFVPENMKIADCLRHLQSAHYHMAIVTSEYGTTIGLVTMEDILEELVGDIHDESDEKQSIITYINDIYTVDATASIWDINEHLPIALPLSDEYDTIAGYINVLFWRIPSQNEKIETAIYQITITKRKKQRVEQVTLKLLEALSG